MSHQRPIVSSNRMMDQMGCEGRVLSVVDEGLEHLGMEFLLAKREKCTLNSLACEFVPESHRCAIQGEHPAGETFLQYRGSPARDRFQEPALGSRGDDGNQFEESTSGR